TAGSCRIRRWTAASMPFARRSATAAGNNGSCAHTRRNNLVFLSALPRPHNAANSLAFCRRGDIDGKARQAWGILAGTAATESPLLHGLRRSPHRLRCGWRGTAFGAGSQLAQPSRIRLAKPDLERAFARTCRITLVGSV